DSPHPQPRHRRRTDRVRRHREELTAPARPASSSAVSRTVGIVRRFVDEWRVLPGTWWVWSLPVVVAAGALLLAPLNARLYHDYLFGALHPVEEYRATAVQLATSGFFVGQVVALLFGAVLVLRDRSAAAPVRPAKLAMAALGGALLGGVTVTAAASVAASRLAGYWAIDTVRHEGRLSPDPPRTAATG